MKKNRAKPNIIIRIPAQLQVEMLADLQREHVFAGERVGFLHARSKWLNSETVLIIATSFQSVSDEDYIEDASVGAKIGSNAIRAAMQLALDNNTGCFHVHLHDHAGAPTPSHTDQNGLPGVVESLSNVAAGQATGYLILSKDGFYSAVNLPTYSGLQSADLITVVGFPMQFHFIRSKQPAKSKVFNRQSFLGTNSQFLFENVRVGIIGYGGGGSHIGQQLAHIGFKYPVIFDDDYIEASNLNRLVGGKWKDVLKKLAKTAIAKRVFETVFPSARVTIINSRWQQAPEQLQQCDLVIGCVDTYAERDQLEAECRRFLIPYIDIGMDVYQVENQFPSIAGQVMLTLPGLPCFWCYGFLTEEKMGKEAAKYGNIGGRPQVIWPNGVLASTATGLLVDLITGWTGRKKIPVYLEYDGNSGIIKDHIRLRFCDNHCSHYALEKAGPVQFKSI